jgi:microsomal dipeptidase-like Zn-dependent dipeptidase
MPHHDNITPIHIAEAIKEVGAKNCILATDFGQKHNPKPADGMKMMIETLLENEISWKEIKIMCMENPLKLLF